MAGLAAKCIDYICTLQVSSLSATKVHGASKLAGVKRRVRGVAIKAKAVMLDANKGDIFGEGCVQELFKTPSGQIEPYKREVCNSIIKSSSVCY